MAQVKPGSDLVVPKVRKAFPDTAYWNPDVRTGADGHARVEFNFPDALTTWRTTIRAMTDDGKAGGVVTRVLVRKNLIVRLAAPRFFRQGDETVLRVIAHNYLETAKDVTFALDVSGVDVVSGQTQKVNIPAKGESYVDWRVKARATGNAMLTAKALTNEESDALEMTLPVLAYGVKQRAAGVGRCLLRDGTESVAVQLSAGNGCGLAGTDDHHCAVGGGHRVRRARLPDQLSVGLHGADDVELPARRDCGAGRGQAASEVAHRSQDAERHGERGA